MKDCLIVFDTNAYRKFVPSNSEEFAKNKISKLKSLESKLNTRALLSTDVAVELYSHLFNLEDEQFNICKNAVIAQFMHCIQGQSVRYIMNSDVHLCNVVFNKLPELSIEVQNKILKMSDYLYSNSSYKYLCGYTKNFKEIADFSNRKKSDHIIDIKRIFSDYIIKPENKNIAKENITPELLHKLAELKEELQNNISIDKLANKLLERAANTLNIKLNTFNDNEKREKTEIIKRQFCVPIIFYRNILKNIIDNIYDYNFDDPKKGNSYWDYELSFQIGNESNGYKIIFITDDKKIHTASKEAGLENKVMRLNDYLKEIGFE